MEDLSLVPAIPSLSFDTSILTGHIAPSSMAMYRRDFVAYLTYAGTPACALKPSTLATWRTVLAQETSMSPNTINRMMSAVKRLMDAAAEQGYISYELAEAFKRVRGVKPGAMKDRTKPRNRVRIEPETMRELIVSIDTSTLIGLRNYAIFATLASTGLRIKELSQLKKEQIVKRSDGYLLHLYAERGKNQIEDRFAYISVEAVDAIGAWLRMRTVESDYIFTAFEGRGAVRQLAKPITSQGVWTVVKEVAEPFIPGVKPHDFRRFVGTQLAKEDIRLAQLALGHKDIATTAKYDLREMKPGATDHLY